MLKFMTSVALKKWWFIATAVVLVAAIYGYQTYKTANTPVPTGRPYTVERGDIIAVVSATGTLSPVNSVDVSSRITGRITDVRVNENDMVSGLKTGDVLMLPQAKAAAAGQAGGMNIFRQTPGK